MGWEDDIVSMTQTSETVKENYLSFSVWLEGKSNHQSQEKNVNPYGRKGVSTV